MIAETRFGRALARGGDGLAATGRRSDFVARGGEAVPAHKARRTCARGAVRRAHSPR